MTGGSFGSELAAQILNHTRTGTVSMTIRGRHPSVETHCLCAGARQPSQQRAARSCAPTATT